MGKYRDRTGMITNQERGEDCPGSDCQQTAGGIIEIVSNMGGRHNGLARSALLAVSTISVSACNR